MKHLTEEQLGMALAARRPVEQWIASKTIDSQTVIHWVRIDANRDGRYAVYNKHVYDPNHQDLLDVSAFSPVDPDHPEGDIKKFDDWRAAVAYAVSLGAETTKFLPSGGIQDEHARQKGCGEDI
jgi:hypothetical protein